MVRGMALECVTSSSRPDLDEEAGAAFRERWPEFIFHDPVPPVYLPRVREYFPQYDVLLLGQGRVVAGGWGVPFAFDADALDLPGGYDDALVRAVEDPEADRAPTALRPRSDRVQLHGRRRPPGPRPSGSGPAGAHRAGQPGPRERDRPRLRPHPSDLEEPLPHGVDGPLRTWTRPDGLCIDPWIRTHQRMGASIIGPAPDSMVIPGTVGEWESCADIPFPG